VPVHEQFTRKKVFPKSSPIKPNQGKSRCFLEPHAHHSITPSLHHSTQPCPKPVKLCQTQSNHKMGESEACRVPIANRCRQYLNDFPQFLTTFGD
jgi:hypothetical protein